MHSKAYYDNQPCQFVFGNCNYTSYVFFRIHEKAQKTNWVKVGGVVGCIGGMGAENTEPIIPKPLPGIRPPTPVTDPGLSTGDGNSTAWDIIPAAIDAWHCIKNVLE
jgi:hypothetical protein